MRVDIIINSKAKGQRSIKKGIDYLASAHRDIDLNTHFTEYAKHSTEFAEKCIQNGSDLIISAGGDGTLNEIVQAFGRFQQNDLPVLAIWPKGTANDFVRNLKSFESVSELVEQSKKGANRSVDLVHLDHPEKPHYYINIAEWGLGATVVERVNRSNKMLGSDVAFLSAVTRAFMRYQYHDVHLQFDNGQWSGPAVAVIIANGRSFGSGLKIAPEAELDSGLLEVIVLGKITMVDYLRNVVKVKRGKKLDHPEVYYFKTSTVEVVNIASDMLFECDGESFDRGVRRISVMPNAIKIVG